jgi:hypothetical protein
MTALLLLVCALWITGGVGRLFLDRLGVLRDCPLERFVYSATFGLGVAAYGVFALGLVGLLAFWPVTVWWLVLAAVGARAMLANARDFGAGIRAYMQTYLSAFSWPSLWIVLCTLALLACGLAAVLACFLPPTGYEWDAISYHLADPKIFLADHRITSLPTEHHSNFPFTMEMLFAVGLLYQGYALADLFHFLTVLALLAFCHRLLSPLAGYAAAVLFATTPPVLWEAHTAYIDLGLGLFATLAAFALAPPPALTPDPSPTLRERGDAPPYEGEGRGEVPAPESGWIVLAGTMMGFALGTKYLALLPFILVGGMLILRRAPLCAIALYAGIAIAIASPWYLKNIVLMRNPVYPYFYKLFPQSRYWSQDRADAYQSEQRSFGYPPARDRPAETLQNLMQLPWNLLVNAERFANRGNFTFMEPIGGLYAAFGFALLFLRRVPRTVRALMLLGVAQVVAWFWVAQVGRYLVAILPLLAVGAGYAVWCLTQPEMRWALGVGRWVGWLAGALVAGQAVMLFWGLFALPTRPREVLEAGLPLNFMTSLSIPEIAPMLGQPDAADAYLRRSLEFYSAVEWINKNTQPEDGVILYEDTRGFYLDRPYLWGNGPHSAYIPYDTLPSGQELTRWLLAHGIRYALINMKWSPQNGRDEALPSGPNQNEEAALRRWYADVKGSPERWRNLLGEALRTEGWSVEFKENGVVVLRLPESVPTSSAQRLTPDATGGMP